MMKEPIAVNPVFEFHIARTVREYYGFDQSIYAQSGNVIFPNIYAVRLFADKMNKHRNLAQYPERVIRTGPTTTQITLALKHGSFYTLDSAVYLDEVSMTALPSHRPIPALDARWLGLLGLLTLGIAWRHVRRA